MNRASGPVSKRLSFRLDETRISLILSFRVVLVSKTHADTPRLLGLGLVYMVLYNVLIFWLNFTIGLNFIFLCFNLIIVNYRTTNQGKREFTPMLKLNHRERALDARCDETVKPAVPVVVVVVASFIKM